MSNPSEILHAYSQDIVAQSVKFSSKSEMVNMEAFVELTWNDPDEYVDGIPVNSRQLVTRHMSIE